MTPEGYYTGTCYLGWTGECDQVTGKRLYMQFETESAYLEWWQDRFVEYLRRRINDASDEN